MRTYLDCYPCFLRQALEAARMAGADEPTQHRVLREVLGELEGFELNSSAPEMAHIIHQIVRRRLGDCDPYLEVKERSTREALALYPRLAQQIAVASDPLIMAIKLAIAGNIIDFGLTCDYDLEGTIERVLAQEVSPVIYDAFREELAAAPWILYIADNAGETVFDRMLIERLDPPVTYVVKGGPILNDATRVDAQAAGLERVATIEDNGSNAPGTILSLCSRRFRELFASAPLIIAKGQANFETLSDRKTTLGGSPAAPLYFLLQAKCPVIARHLDVSLMSIVFERARAGE